MLSKIKNIILRGSVFLFISLLATQLCPAQVDYIFNHKNLSIQDGLPVRWTKCIAEDNNNLLWVGTNRGLSRYDGYQFSNLSKYNSQLRSDRVMEILKDNKGMLWVADMLPNRQISPKNPNEFHRTHPSSIDIIDPITLEIKTFDQYISNVTFSENEIAAILSTNKGIWIESFNKQYFLYENDKLTEFFDLETREKYHSIIPLDKDKYCGYSNNLIEIFDSNGIVLNKYSLPDDHTIRSIINKNGQLWILSIPKSIHNPGKIFNIPPNGEMQEILADITATIPSIQLGSSQNNFQIHEWIDNQYWIKISQKVYLINSDHQCSSFLSNDDKISSQISNYIYLDSYNNLAVATVQGIDIFSLGKRYFQNYLNRESKNINTRGIYMLPDNHLVILSVLGICSIQVDSSGNRVLCHPDTPYGSSILQITSDYLLESAGSKIAEINISNPELFIQETYSQFSNTTTALLKDSQNNIWVGSENGISSYDHESKTHSLDNYYNRDSTLSKSHITYFHENDQGIWVCSLEGIFLVKPDSGVIAHYNEDNNLPYNRVYHIHEDQDGFWLSTNGGGLIQWNHRTETFHQFTKENGLSSNFIHAAYEDRDGFLWLSSDYGLMRFNKQTHEVQTYTTRDGISDNEFNRSSHFQSEDGTIYFGGINGVTSFDPTELNKQPVSDYNLLFTKINAFDKSKSEFSSKLTEYNIDNTISLNPNNTYLNVEYTLTDFIKDTDTQYAYKVEGLDDSWKYTKQNNLQLGRIPYGEYKLQIKGQGLGGNWAKQELTLAIIVEKPIYLKWSFILFMVLLGSGFIYLGIQWRLSFLRKSNLRLRQEVDSRTAELHEVNRSKDKLFAVLAHDLRGPISSFKNISKKVQYLISKGQWDTLDKMTEQIHDDTTRLDQLISNLIPWVLVQSKNPKIIPSTFNLAGVLEKTIAQLGNNIKSKDINIINNINPKSTIVADVTAVEIIIRNILSNAIKYSHNGGQIEISSSSQHHFTTLFIKDSGVGMSKEYLSEIFSEYASKRGTAGERGHGLGLKLARDLAVRNQGSLDIHSTVGSGTTVALKLPQT